MSSFLFNADEAVLWNIFQFLDIRDYALVSYHSLKHVGPKKYETLSIFAANLSGGLNDAGIRFIHNLPVPPSKVPRGILSSYYREDAFDEYVARGIYHDKMAERLMDMKGIDVRTTFGRGLPHIRPDIISKGSLDDVKKYMAIIANPLDAINDCVSRLDATHPGMKDHDVSTKICEWIKATYHLTTKIIRPQKKWSLDMFDGVAIIDYSILECIDKTVIPFGTANSVYANVALRDDADSFDLHWPRRDAATSRTAILKGHVKIINHILADPRHIIAHLCAALYVAPEESGEAFLEACLRYDVKIPENAGMTCMALYIHHGRPISDQFFRYCSKGYGISRAVYNEYLRIGGQIRYAPYVDKK